MGRLLNQARRIGGLLAATLLAGCAALPGALPIGEGGRVSGEWRNLNAVYYRDEPGKGRLSGVTRLRATVLPNTDQAVRVGVLEQYAGATGEAWRSSVWLASFLAARAVGTDLTRHRFNISVGGIIDGASAGALMAVGFVAALRGDAVRPGISVTGALAPDSSVAPVGGVLEKVRAAAKGGIRILGIPRGQALAADGEGPPEDAVALGRSLGVEVREVADLREAYELVTGVRLPRPGAVEPLRLSLSPDLRQRLQGRITALLARTEEKLVRAARLGTDPARDSLARASRVRVEAKVHLARGELAAAYLRATRATALARAALRQKDVPVDVAGPTVTGLNQTERNAEALEQDLRTVLAAGRPDLLAVLGGFSAAARARGELEIARTLLLVKVDQSSYAGPGARELQHFQGREAAVLSALHQSFADLEVEAARDALAAGAAGPRLKVDLAAVQSTAQSFASAASGNVQYFRAIVLQEVAEKLGKSLAEVRLGFGLNEPSYPLAAELAEIAVRRVQGESPGPATWLLLLFEAVHSYLESAKLIAKYYSLEAELPQGTAEAKLRRAQALQGLLEHAERSAREGAALAWERIGAIPAEAQLHYQKAMSLRGGSVRERLRALSSFWRAQIASEVAAAVLRREAASAGDGSR